MSADIFGIETIETAIAITVEEIATHNDVLPYPRRTRITRGWFDHLLLQWSVGRTIRRGCKEQIRQRFEARYLAQILDGHAAEAVTAIATELQQDELSALVGKQQTQSFPISLTSKVAFFYAPASLPPIDTYSRQGVNAMLRRCGAPQQVAYADYVSYCKAFQQLYDLHSALIASACASRNSEEAAQQQGISASHLFNPLLHRRVLDLALMVEGGKTFRNMEK